MHHNYGFVPFGSWYSHAQRNTTSEHQSNRRDVHGNLLPNADLLNYFWHTMHRATEIDGGTYMVASLNFNSFWLHSCRIDSDGNGGNCSSWLQNVRTSTRLQSPRSPKLKWMHFWKYTHAAHKGREKESAFVHLQMYSLMIFGQNSLEMHHKMVFDCCAAPPTSKRQLKLWQPYSFDSS